MTGYMGIGIVVVVAVLLIVGYIVLYNRLRRLAVKVEEAGSDIDVALEKRYDVLSEEIEAVKKFLEHEYETYTSVTAIRTGKELEEEAFRERKALSREALETIDEAIRIQSEKMEEIRAEMTEQKIGLMGSIQNGLGRVNSAIDALSEQYPTLYSSVSMEHFQKTIYDTEEHLQAARRLYNANVSLYNQKIASFPWLLVARLHGMKEAQFYETEEKKKDYRVTF